MNTNFTKLLENPIYTTIVICKHKSAGSRIQKAAEVEETTKNKVFILELKNHI